MNSGVGSPKVIEPLEHRFHRFIASLQGTEAIDTLLANSHLENERRADYLLADRRVILELKELKTDTSPKVDKELDKHREKEEFPLIYGEVELQQILRHLPDGATINRRIYGSVNSQEHIGGTSLSFDEPDQRCRIRRGD